jgi:hypothetical protein
MRARFASLAFPLALAWPIFALTACSKHPTEPAPFVGNEPGPDLRAEEVFLFEPSWPIGVRAQAATGPRRAMTAGTEPQRAMRASAAATPVQLGDVIVGVSVLPAVRQTLVGSFHGYRVRFYANDVLFWDRESDSQSPPGVRVWEDLYGLMWAPPDTGTYTLRVVIDATHRFDELDETNNEAIGIIHSVPGDLSAAITEFRVDGQPDPVMTVHAGTTVHVIAGVGAYGVYPNVRRVVSLDGVTMVDERRDLRGGMFADVHYDTLSFTPTTPGNYTWTATIDPDHETLERTRDNNTGSRTLNVVPFP